MRLVDHLVVLDFGEKLAEDCRRRSGRPGVMKTTRGVQ
jgi:hypothetical protein